MVQLSLGQFSGQHNAAFELCHGQYLFLGQNGEAFYWIGSFTRDRRKGHWSKGGLLVVVDCITTFFTLQSNATRVLHPSELFHAFSTSLCWLPFLKHNYYWPSRPQYLRMVDVSFTGLRIIDCTYGKLEVLRRFLLDTLG